MCPGAWGSYSCDKAAGPGKVKMPSYSDMAMGDALVRLGFDGGPESVTSSAETRRGNAMLN